MTRAIRHGLFPICVVWLCQSLCQQVWLIIPCFLHFTPFTFGMSEIKTHSMKKIMISTFFLLGSFYYSQSITEKYNSIYKRYEYFDSIGNMIGYKSYNNLSQQWEYYDLKTTQKQPYQYAKPQQLDISVLGNALSIKQNNYNNNVKQIQRALDNVIDQVRNFDISEDKKEVIIKKISDSFINNIMSKNFDYSSVSETNRIVRWIYDSANIIIKNVTTY